MARIGITFGDNAPRFGNNFLDTPTINPTMRLSKFAIRNKYKFCLSIPLMRMNSLPTFIDDEILGRMEYNPKLRWYEGWLDNELLGIAADISLPAKTQHELAVHSELLRKAVHSVERLVDLGKDSAQNRYFDSGYLDDPSTNASGFRDRLELTTLWIEDSGRLALSFSTDGMFPGHAIRVDFDSELSKASSTLW